MKNLNNIKNFIFFILSFFVNNIFAQKTIVYGKVLDAKTGDPLPFVNLIFKNRTVGTSTDLEGKYYIETMNASDTLIAVFVGYKSLKKKVKPGQKQEINFFMEQNVISLQEVVIKAPKENPAIRILKKAIKNKKFHDKDKLDSYEYEVYNKVEFDLNNITEDFKNKRALKPFKFIFDYVDTTGDKTYLPLFLIETLSKVYYKKFPKTTKEHIIASKISGVKNKSVSQFLGDMYQNVNIYDNYVNILGKRFVSPLSDFARVYYKYYLLDSAYIDGHRSYKLRFMPKRKFEPTFTGDMWIDDTDFAVTKIDMSISNNSDINFVTHLDIKQDFTKVDNKYWMLKKDKMIVDFALENQIMGFYGKKTTSYTNFKINKDINIEPYKGPNDIIVDDDAYEKSEVFWEKARHDSLTHNEKAIYSMIDTLKKVPQFQTYVDIITMFVTGYKVIGKFELGPYFTTYSWNPVEGHRFRFGARTSNDFSTRLMIDGYAAYGLTDTKFKYGGGFSYFLTKKPRQIIDIHYKKDVEQLGKSVNAFREDNILNSFFRRNPLNKLTMTEELKSTLEREWFQGFSTKLLFYKRTYWPLGTLEFNIDKQGDIVSKNNIKTSELGVFLRFAYKEKFVEGEFERVSLGTRFPILKAQYIRGIKGFWDGEYSYHKINLGVEHYINTPPLGYFKYIVETGKIFGKLPFPLLELHPGNETYSYDIYAFNLMNYFEFVSDEYISLNLTQHFEGFFLSHIPILRKLKLREVASFKGVWGKLTEDHKSVMLFPEITHTFTAIPYMEASLGIENILKLLRVDGLWRMTYLDHKNVKPFGIRLSLQVMF